MIEVYKEPNDLLSRLRRTQVVVSTASIVAGLTLCLGLFWIVRYASRFLASQQQQLVANETYVVMGEMSSAVAHSLRNPLAVIRSSAELALELDEISARKNINDIISQVDRMSSWVRDLLASSGPQATADEPVDIVSQISDALKVFEPQFRQKKIAVELNVIDRAVVLGQNELCIQLLNSLFSNAVEAMPEGGLLRIIISRQALRPWLVVTIVDTGRGMSEGQLEMAFKPSFTTKKSGLGVGLSLVKRIMERFGGSVHLDSNEGMGTSVYLKFRIIEG